LRNSDAIFWPEDGLNTSLRQSMEKNYSDCINILQTQWYQADVDQRFYLGDQDIWGLIFPGVATYRRKIWNFNIMNPICQAISGHQRQSRKSTQVIPIHNGQQKTADQLTKCLYHNHKNGFYQTLSDAFELGALVQGLGFMYLTADYTQDPVSPAPVWRYVDMKSCLYDPYWRKHDMSDSRYWWVRTFFDRDEAAVLYQQFADDILSLPKGTYRDDKFYYMPEVYQIQFPNLIAFDEYWYLTNREATFLVDKKTQETQEWKGTKNELHEMMRLMKEVYRNDKIAVIKRPVPTVRRSIILNDRVMVDEPNPLGMDRYPVVPTLAYFTADTPYYAYKFRGVCRDLRDPQYLLNRLKVSNLEILDAQQQGLKVKKGALVTPEDALNQGHGRVLSIDPEFQMTDVEPMPIVPPSPVMLQMEEMLKGIFYNIAGIDPSAMGIDVDDKAGIISMMRQAATARNLQKLFDQLDEAQRLCGDLEVEFIQNLWTYGKVKAVIGEDPAPEFDNKLFFKYGCKVTQSALTESQQQLELAQLLELQTRYPELVPVDEVLECMTIQNKDRIVNKIMQRQKAMEEQQSQMAQLQMQQMQVDNQTKLSYASSQEGLAQERKAKIYTDIAVAEDKLRRAHEEDTSSLLNLVKALKELKNVDIAHLTEQIKLLQALSPAANPEKETVANKQNVA
jgi:hypothetical protein